MLDVEVEVLARYAWVVVVASAIAGGLLFRCAECSLAFCEDCLPPNSRVINESSRFAALGFSCPKSACYVLCSERCSALAREHAAPGI